MQPFTLHTGIVAPLSRANIDTDMIIPKQFLKSIKRSGFGPNLFDELRYLDEGQPDADNSQRPKNPDFILNQPPYTQSSILLAGENFGCGSSREHAPWALEDFGFRAIISESFADIFFNNCFKNGLLPITLPPEKIADLFQRVQTHQAYELSIDLPNQSVFDNHGLRLDFEIDAFRKHCLINGLDDIGLTLQDADAIRAYENKRKNITPWLFS